MRYPCKIRCYSLICTKYFLCLYPIQCNRRICFYLAPSFIGSWYAITFLTFFIFVQLLILQGIEVTTMEEGTRMKKIYILESSSQIFCFAHLTIHCEHTFEQVILTAEINKNAHIFAALHYF